MVIKLIAIWNYVTDFYTFSVLIILHERVMPHLTKPLLMTDFLMESYDVGGSISLLALNGVFHLIHKYNLEYPDFYKKLYALFTPDVLHVKYRARYVKARRIWSFF